MATSTILHDGARTIRVLGTMHIVFGVLWLAWSLARLIVAVNSEWENGLAQGQIFGLLSVLWIVSGIGMARCARWGRVLGIVWAWLAVGVFFLLFQTARMRASYDPVHTFWPSVIGFAGLAYAIVIAIVLARSPAFGPPRA